MFSGAGFSPEQQNPGGRGVAPQLAVGSAGRSKTGRRLVRAVFRAAIRRSTEGAGWCLVCLCHSPGGVEDWSERTHTTAESSSANNLNIIFFSTLN